MKINVIFIDKPTANGKTCKIPFDLEGVTYYHCSYPDKTCKDENGDLFRCQTSG